MQVFIDTLEGYILSSFPVGFFIGFLYDTLCVLPRLIKNKRKSFFLADFIFALLLFTIFFLTTYSNNSGTYRIYSFTIICIAAIVFKLTLGQILLSIELAVLNSSIIFFKYISKKFNYAIDISVKFVKIKLDIYRINIYKRKLLRYAHNGFPRKDRYERKCKKTNKK